MTASEVRNRFDNLLKFRGEFIRHYEDYVDLLLGETQKAPASFLTRALDP